MQSSVQTADDGWANMWDGGAWYLGLQAGGNWMNRHTRLDRFDVSPAVTTKATYDNGYIGSVTGGYAMPDGFRLQLDLADRYNPVDGLYGYGAGHGAMQSYAATVDALYDLPLDYWLRPYIGVGVGGASYAPQHIHADGMPGSTYFGGNAVGWDYQGIAGVAYNVSDNVAFTLEYRYNIIPDAHPAGVRTDYQSNSALIGVRYSFGAPAHAYQTTQASYTPPPPTPPAPARAPHDYLVFFDFNKSDLSSNARNIVDQAAQNAKSNNVTRLNVTGYTDTVGSDAYNMRLSRRRAESVAAELENQGVAASDIAIFAKGKHDLLVPTADGVREPQNRRVQIVFGGGVTS